MHNISKNVLSISRLNIFYRMNINKVNVFESILKHRMCTRLVHVPLVICRPHTTRFLDGDALRLPPRRRRIKAGACRPCDTIELTATSCNFSLCRRVEKVCVDRQLLRYS